MGAGGAERAAGLFQTQTASLRHAGGGESSGLQVCLGSSQDPQGRVARHLLRLTQVRGALQEVGSRVAGKQGKTQTCRPLPLCSRGPSPRTLCFCGSPHFCSPTIAGLCIHSDRPSLISGLQGPEGVACLNSSSQESESNWLALARWPPRPQSTLCRAGHHLVNTAPNQALPAGLLMGSFLGGACGRPVVGKIRAGSRAPPRPQPL